jgi:pectate disaccharide-lyase
MTPPNYPNPRPPPPAVVLVVQLGGSALAILVLFFLPSNLMAATYYVSPSGSDANSGTIGSPFYTISNAVTHVSAGDTIYVRGGSYSYSNKVFLTTSGTASATNNIWAYPNENPILDYSGMRDTNTTGKAFEITGNYWYLRGLEVQYASDNGIRIRGNSNTVERCVFHHNKNTGFMIGLEGSSVNTGNQAAHNTVINCDSYRNCDVRKSGGDADGFACKNSPGPYNAFYGCRAWENSDDGLDLFYGQFAVVISNCWTWHSGDGSLFPQVPAFDGNGNGFKLGGTGTSYSHGIHQVMNCVAFNNIYTTGRGFDQNSHHSGMIVYNCLSFDNKQNYRFNTASDDGTTNFFKNNVSFAGTTTDIFVTGTVQLSNSWNSAGVTVNSNDFNSVTEAMAAAPRNADGSLPTGFARLVAGSDLIDKGINVGFPYNGSAPDLGAFEFFVPQGIVSIDAVAMTATGFSLHVTGLTSHGPVVVHTSPDLGGWTPIYTNAPVTGSWQYVDPAATNADQQFYKVQEQ